MMSRNTNLDYSIIYNSLTFERKNHARDFISKRLFNFNIFNVHNLQLKSSEKQGYKVYHF